MNVLGVREVILIGEHGGKAKNGKYVVQKIDDDEGDDNDDKNRCHYEQVGQEQSSIGRETNRNRVDIFNLDVARGDDGHPVGFHHTPSKGEGYMDQSA